MAAAAATSLLESSFHDLERQRDLIDTCTRLWKDLSDHFDSVDRHLLSRTSAIRSKILDLDASTERTLSDLRRRESTLDSSLSLASAAADSLRSAALRPLSDEPPPPDLAGRLRASCLRLDPAAFWDLLLSSRREAESIRAEIAAILSACADPPGFALDAVSAAFPVDRGDCAWACVMVLESLVEVLTDPVLGDERKLVTPSVRERAEGIAKNWREELDRKGGIECVRPTDAHTYLQHVATFGIAVEEDHGFYRKLVVSSSWRKQVPKLAVELGLGHCMEEIIDELISKGQQLDAVNFAYEAGLVDKFPPAPLLKAYLEESTKAATSILEDRNNSGRAVHLAGRKEQSALRAVIKCIEDHKLESEFPPEELRTRLEQLEKAKTEKKKPVVVSVPANKRTRASSGGPMPPAKAGRLTNHAHVSSFPSPPTFIRSPSAHSPYSAASPYGYDRPSIPSPYGSQSPPAFRDPYAYRQEEVAPPPMAMPYACPPLSYPLYAGYSAGYSAPLSPGYQPIYYR